MLNLFSSARGDISVTGAVMEVMFKRFEKYGIALHPEKTKLIVLNHDQAKNTFDFLGFTHYMGKSLKGRPILKRRTSKKKLKSALKKMNHWLRENRHTYSFEGLIAELNCKLDGYYEYYGITFNRRSLHKYYEQTKRFLFNWLNRRGNKLRLNWNR
jgi:RNA-directed DNA polymerase